MFALSSLSRCAGRCSRQVERFIARRKVLNQFATKHANYRLRLSNNTTMSFLAQMRNTIFDLLRENAGIFF